MERPDPSPLSCLPEDVRARTRVLRDGAVRARPYVLYWMRVAVRDHENPALDAAVAAANAHDATVLVYHGVSERYPFASDRHHTFILEGARDVACSLHRRGIAYALHVERPGARQPVLRALAEGAALVVTEDAPFPPLSMWTRRLAEHLADKHVPLWVVDASCVVPMPLLTKRYDRAFQFRNDTRPLAAASLARPWADVAPARPGSLPELPFSPVTATTLDDVGIARLVAECEIDHGVGPVRELRGGAAAGYARWEAFRREGLAQYDLRRNDAAIDGTSRLSPWLHYGHVSPFRIAREALHTAGTGAQKFLDELLIWRELAWNFAAHTMDLETLDALPEWARATLEAHAGDARTVLSVERLARGRTGDALWDLAQRSLVAHGELHNNVRMTWGKALPRWTATPEDARRALVTLNHRYALDGRDPSSYGGLYWCLGLFDRPFLPERPILGTVRERPTSVHAARLDGEAFAARARRPTRKIGRVAIVGAGVAGLACARTLVDHNVDVVVFDKGRSPGGRLASRSIGNLTVDLGAQYFTVTDERFQRVVASWVNDGIVAPWEGGIRAVPASGGGLRETATVERFVGTPTMGAIAFHLACDVDVRASHRVDLVARQGGAFLLRGTVAPSGTTLGARDGEPSEMPLCELGAFDVLVVCLPPAQAREILEGINGPLATRAGDVKFDPCIALGFTTDDEALNTAAFDGLFVGRDGDADRVVAWVARESSKPLRAGEAAWTVHAAPEWSAAHLRDSPDRIERALLDDLPRVLGIRAVQVTGTTLQRWSFARPVSRVEGPLFDEEARIGVGGDWTAGGRVEGAFLSGVALAGRVLGLPDKG